MKRADEVRTEHKLDTITHYLLKAFPGAAIQAARVNGGDSLLTVRTPHVISPCTLRIPRAFLNEAHPTGEEIPVLFDHLQLTYEAVSGEPALHRWPEVSRYGKWSRGT
jgi:hypothetical protein